MSNDDHARQFGDWLSGQLERRGMTPNELARETGIADTSVYRYVRGRGRPDSDKAIALAAFFGADQDHVLGLAGHRAPVASPRPDDPRLELYAKLDALDWTPARHRLLMAIADSLLHEDRERGADG